MTSWFKQLWISLRLWGVALPKDEEYVTTSGERYRPLYVSPDDGLEAIRKKLRRGERLYFIYRHYDSNMRVTTEQLRPVSSSLDLQLASQRFPGHLRLVAAQPALSGRYVKILRGHGPGGYEPRMHTSQRRNR